VYPHEDYRYMTDRGGPSTVGAGLSVPYDPSTTAPSIGFDATGLGFAENNHGTANPSDYCHPEDIPGSYEQTQGWQWECHSTTGQAVVAPASLPHPHPLALPQLHAPVLPQLPSTTNSPPDPAFLDLTSTIKSAVTVERSQNYSSVRSPTAQLPTPAAMAVLLNPNGHGREQTPAQVAMDAGLSAQQPPPAMMQMSSGVADATALIPVPDLLSREKKHACTMCHKR
jgi:hypothetical protein